jgi:hypothetical protein
MFLRSKIQNLEPLALAALLAPLLGGAAVLLAAALWGRAGVIAAGLGALVSVANLWVLGRLSARAARRAAAEGGGGAAAIGLQAALSAKTVVLLVLVASLVGGAGGGLDPAPFVLGLLVSVVALLAAGLLSALDNGAVTGSHG